MLKLGAANHVIHDTTGTKMNLTGPSKPQGEVSISIGIPSIYHNMCGWFWDIHSEINNFGFLDTGGNKMWVVLKEKTLFCHDNPYDGVVKNVIDTKKITDIVETVCDKLEIKVK